MVASPGSVVRVLTPSGPRPAIELPPRGTVAQPWPPSFILATPLPRRRRLRRLSKVLLALAVLQVLDLGSTLLLLSIGGIEANPVSAWLLRQGAAAFVVTKVGLAILLAAFVPVLERDRRAATTPALTWTAAGFDVAYSLAVLTNLLQFIVFA